LRAEKAVVSKNHFFSAKTETGKKKNKQIQTCLIYIRAENVRKNHT